MAQGELEVAIYIRRTSVFWSFLGFFGGDFLFFLDSRRMWLESRWRIIETAVLSDRFISSVPANQETNFSCLATSEGINVVID